MTIRRRGCRLAAATLLCLMATGYLLVGRPDASRALLPPPPAPSGPPITIALLPERNIFEQRKRYKPLQEYLSVAIGRPVAFKLLDDYQFIFDEIMAHRVDGAFFSSTNGAIAQIRNGVVMLARPVDLQGASTYSSVLFTGTGSSITKDPRTWKTRRIALVSKVTTSSLYTLSLLRQSGYRGKMENYFGRLTYAGSHDAAILAVFNGEADFGVCKNTVYDDFLKRRPDIQRRLTVLDVSAEVPANALGVHPDLSPEIRRALREALLGMHASEHGQRALRQFGAQRFIETGLGDYEPVFALARRAGEDLATWSLK